MTHPNTPTTDAPKRSRLGPIEAAIRDRDVEALRAAIAPRTSREPGSSCWLWTGAHTPSGYARVGRGATAKSVHRIVAWAEAGFVGDLKAFPHVHHLCGPRKDCLNAAHLVPVSSALNTLEAGARGYFRKRILDLEDALRSLVPDHPLLSTLPTVGETPALLNPKRTASPRERVRLRAAAIRQREERERNRQFRFEQVLRVQQLRREGRTYRQAIAEVGIARRTYEHWADQLRNWLEGNAA